MADLSTRLALIEAQNEHLQEKVYHSENRSKKAEDDAAALSVELKKNCNP